MEDSVFHSQPRDSPQDSKKAWTEGVSDMTKEEDDVEYPIDNTSIRGDEIVVRTRGVTMKGKIVLRRSARFRLRKLCFF
jgi:hypothetical protein